MLVEMEGLHFSFTTVFGWCQGVPDTEHGVGAITGALTSFPTEHVFQVGSSRDTQKREWMP